LWTGIYAVLVLLVVGCAVTVPAMRSRSCRRSRTQADMPAGAALGAARRHPVGLMLSTTTHLTTDIVAIRSVGAAARALPAELRGGVRGGRKARTTSPLLAPVIILIAGGLAFTSGTRDPFFSATLGLLLCSWPAVALHTSCSGCGPRRPPHAFLSGDVVRRHAGRPVLRDRCALWCSTGL
jgi:hypothetical protein